MKVLLRPPEGGKKDDVEMEINVDEMIESVKKKITEKKGFDAYKLVYKGVSMHNERTLRSYGVEELGVISCQAQYQGQYMPMGVTPQMEKISAEKRKAEEAEVEELAPDAKRAATIALEENITEAIFAGVGARCATYGEKGMRRQMEDEALICTSLAELIPALPKERDYALMALFDGHGGKQVAGFIKTYLAVELGNAFANDEPKEGPLNDKRLKKIVEATFHRMDSRIAAELPGCYDGCTAVVCLMNSEQVICANLGDSMAYLGRNNLDSGELQSIPLQMRQHKCWMMKEKERILRSGGAVENGRINGVLEVSRAFGDITLKKFGVLCTPEYMKFKVDRDKDSFVIMACDGFWNAWPANEAIEFTKDLLDSEEGRAERDEEAFDLRSVCRDLVQHVLEEKKAQDNVTVVILYFLKDVPGAA